MSKINLSIYLIKEEINNFEDIVENADVLHKYNENSIIYYSSSIIKEPEWLFKFFQINSDELKTANSRVLFLKKINVSDNKSRIFAIPFGYGKNLLKDNVCEEQFGLKIVLNTIDINKIRKISKIDIGKNYKQSQEQMPKESDIGEFGFDIERDLIKYVTGKSDDDKFGNAIISGGDIFNLSIEINIKDIDEFLLYCYNKYLSDTYKTNFKWLDNIKCIKDKKLIEILNNEVVKILNQRNFDKIWLAIPEVINWENVKCIYISGQQNKNEEYQDIDNFVFINSFKESKIENFDQIKSKYILAKSTEDKEHDIAKWSASKCLVGSIEYEGQVYAINSGSWYKINKDFAKEINDFYNSIPLSKLNFIDCFNDEHEDDYNEKLVKNMQGSHLIHKYKIPFGGGQGNNIEPCDIALDKTLIYIKNNEGSSYLSHLFFQATNSCSALKDENFRNIFKKKLKRDGINDFFADDFKASDYTIILGIINKYTEDRPRIPFFSKVSIKYASQQISNLGYHFELKNIKKLKENNKD